MCGAGEPAPTTDELAASARIGFPQRCAGPCLLFDRGTAPHVGGESGPPGALAAGDEAATGQDSRPSSPRTQAGKSSRRRSGARCSKWSALAVTTILRTRGGCATHAWRSRVKGGPPTTPAAARDETRAVFLSSTVAAWPPHTARLPTLPDLGDTAKQPDGSQVIESRTAEDYLAALGPVCTGARERAANAKHGHRKASAPTCRRGGFDRERPSPDCANDHRPYPLGTPEPASSEAGGRARRVSIDTRPAGGGRLAWPGRATGPTRSMVISLLLQTSPDTTDPGTNSSSGPHRARFTGSVWSGKTRLPSTSPTRAPGCSPAYRPDAFLKTGWSSAPWWSAANTSPTDETAQKESRGRWTRVWRADPGDAGAAGFWSAVPTAGAAFHDIDMAKTQPLQQPGVAKATNGRMAERYVSPTHRRDRRSAVQAFSALSHRGGMTGSGGGSEHCDNCHDQTFGGSIAQRTR